MLQKIIDIIHRGRTFLVTAHERLDGDALGSELALYAMLTDLRKQAVVYNQDEIPGNYRFLPGSESIVSALPPPETFDAAFILDCSELDRVGREAPRIAGIRQLVNIDHHVSNGGFCDTVLLDPKASSTGEILCRVMTAMNWAPTPPAATCLYTAILTDTGGFHYGNTTPEALMAASGLVVRGADPQWISENVYESNPLAKIRLLGAVLETLALDGDDRVGSLTVTREVLARTGAAPEHTDGLVDLPRTIRGVDVSVLFSEMEDSRIKVSLRSKGRVNVERVARAFGGGGHVNAAACRVEGDVDMVKRKVIAAVVSRLEAEGRR